MKLGLLLSALFHLAVILAGMVVLPAKWEDQETFEMIPVELLTVAEVTNVIAKAEETAPEQLEVPEVEDRHPREAPPPEPEPEQREISEDAFQKLEDKPKEEEPEPKVEEKPKVVPESQASKARPRRKPTPPAPEKKKDDFDFDNIAALLDKKPEDEQKPKVESQDALDENFLADVRDLNQQKQGLGTDLTMSELDYLKAAMQECWRPPVGSANPEDYVVVLRVFLNRDGTVSGRPEVISSGRSVFSANTFSQAYENAAIRAVDKCAPYDLLPEDKYDRWREVEIKFDPAKMIGR